MYLSREIKIRSSKFFGIEPKEFISIIKTDYIPYYITYAAQIYYIWTVYFALSGKYGREL